MSADPPNAKLHLDPIWNDIDSDRLMLSSINGPQQEEQQQEDDEQRYEMFEVQKNDKTRRK